MRNFAYLNKIFKGTCANPLMPFKLVFDKVILKQLQKAAKNQQVKEILTKMLDRIEEKGPDAGELLDSKIWIYEVKSKKPPIRLYFKHDIGSGDIYVFEYEMKSSQGQQSKTIDRLRKKSLES